MAEDAARRIERLEAENAGLRARYERLSSRKAVRAALWLTRVLRPRRGSPTHAPPASVAGSAEVGTRLEEAVFDLDLLEMAAPVSVVIPVHNAAVPLRRCLESVIAHTSTADEIIVIDDASTDPVVADVLQEVEGRPNVRVVRQPQNLGFTRTVNAGVRLAEGDVIILNSDTEVPPLWVERLRRAAYSGGDIASVTAVSNNAGAFSAPVPGGGRRPGDRSVAELGRTVARVGIRLVDTPTANGFCCYLKRAALDDVGLFDEEAFPRGYGEENDWSLRAAAVGWTHVVATDVYVLHERSASFGGEREILASEGARTLADRHPGYQKLFDEFVSSRKMAQYRSEVEEVLAGPPPRPRVLAIIHALGGGTEHSTFDLAAALEDYEVFILKCWPHRWSLMDASGSELEKIGFASEVAIADMSSSEQRAALGRILVEYDIELVHVRHLMHQSIGNLAAARALGLPVVLSLHDYYLICPTAHLIDEQGRYCAGRCTPGQGDCPAVAWVEAGPHLKHGWISTWQRRTRSLLEGVDVVSAASEFTLDLHREVLAPDQRAEWIAIGHGRDLDHGPRLGVDPAGSEQVRVVLAGTIGDHKGNTVVREVLHRVPQGSVEFHVLGTFPGPDLPGVVVHGRYERSEFARLVAGIRPAAVAILSVTPETWSHTLTEAWASALPVIAFDHGAPADRIRAEGGGWLIPPGDIDALIEVLNDLGAGRADHAEKVVEAARSHWSSTAEMAERYSELFRSAGRRRRTAAS